jgi:chromosome segregation ATPase
MKIVSKLGCVYALIAALALAVVGLDHYIVNKELRQFELDNIANQQQFMDMCKATGTIQFAEKAQEVALLQSRKLAKLDELLGKYAEGVKQLRDENLRLQTVLEESAETIKSLTDENAKLGAQLDVRMESLTRAMAELKAANKAIDDLKAAVANETAAKIEAEKKIEELQNKLNDAINNVNCLKDDLKKATTGA